MRLYKAYSNDWTTTSPDSGPAPAFRGYPAPVSDPPFPFTVWPYGGSVAIGQPFTQSGPLMEAIWSGPNGEAGKSSASRFTAGSTPALMSAPQKAAAIRTFPRPMRSAEIRFSWIRKFSTSSASPTPCRPIISTGAFAFLRLYGLDYRFTTAKGIFSNQLLGKNQENGFDVPMAYFDLYIPQVAQGMDIRVGRYISLPDIEAQLAPNNYTYSHSLTYTFDCYTQTGINVTTKLNNHWLFQIGFSAGCDVAPWTRMPRQR